MEILKQFLGALLQLARQVCLLPYSIAAALKRRRKQFDLDQLELERLDRIRNPSKYLGK
jgi:hypothetical protein